MNTLQQLLMTKKTTVNLKKASEWWKLKVIILKKTYLTEGGKRKGIHEIIRQNA